MSLLTVHNDGINWTKKITKRFLSSLNICTKIFNQRYRGHRVWLEKRSISYRKRLTTTKKLVFSAKLKQNFLFASRSNLAKKFETLTSAKKGTCWLSPQNFTKEGKKLSLELEKRKMNGEKKNNFYFFTWQRFCLRKMSPWIMAAFEVGKT